MHSIIVSDSIYLDTENLTSAQISKIEQECTVPNSEYVDAVAFGQWIPPDMPEAYAAFEYKDGYMVIQRGFLSKLQGILGDVSIKYETAVFEDTGFKLKKPLRDYQIESIEKLIEKQSGILVAPTGSGKTNIMIGLIEKLQQPTIILVHKNILLDQWKERLQSFLGYNPGIIGEGKARVKNITVAMIPTLIRRPRLIKKLSERFGLIIVDECHHVPSDTWFYALSGFKCHYRFGCSATPSRKDRMQKLMYLAIGEIAHIISDKNMVKVGAILPGKIVVCRTGFFWPTASNRRQYTKMIQSMVKDTKRNNLIISQIKKYQDTKQLVLSDRVVHLKNLHAGLSATTDIKSTVIYGSSSLKQRQEALRQIRDGEIGVIFATSIADEGLDEPCLETLHLTFPTRNPQRNTQQFGRIRRPYPGKKDAIVIDYYDWKIKTLQDQFRERRSYFTSIGFSIILPKLGEFINES